MTRLLRLAEPEIAVALRRSARARRLTLTVPRPGAPPRLTAPPGVSEAEILAFLERQSDWLRDALARAGPALPVRPGARIPVEGREVEIVAAPGRRAPPYLEAGRLVLRGGGADAAGPRIEAWLKEGARARLTAIVADCAATLGARAGRISLRDTRGRWGSCTMRGDLSFSWRLAMAPASVLDYVAAHEAAHLLEMNHGPRFWALVEGLRPGWRAERDWLKRRGGALHAYRFRPEPAEA